MRSLALYLIGLAVFQTGRLLLHWANAESFRELGLGRTAWAYLHGIRFDASVWLTLAGAPLLLLMIPHRTTHSRGWVLAWGWVCLASAVGTEASAARCWVRRRVDRHFACAAT